MPRSRSRPAGAGPTAAGRSACASRRSTRTRDGRRPARSPRGARDCAASVRVATASVLHDAPHGPARARSEAPRSALRRLDEPQPVLDLRDPQLELLVLRAQDEAELAQRLPCMPAPARSVTRVTSPRQRETTSSIAARASSRCTPPRSANASTSSSIALRRQRGSSDPREQELRDQVARRPRRRPSTWLCHAASTAGAAAAARALRPHSRLRAPPLRPATDRARARPRLPPRRRRASLSSPPAWPGLGIFVAAACVLRLALLPARRAAAPR